MSSPTIVSFFCGARYYHDAADLLRGDCQRLGLRFDIRELDPPIDDNWAATCRRKIAFYEEMLGLHPQGIFWVDIDTRVLRAPRMLDGGQYDFGAFLRGFRDLRAYDPASLTRTFHPGLLHFTGTEATARLVASMRMLESASDVNGTDDYFLEEAFRRFSPGLNVQIFSPHLIAKTLEEADERTCFVFGASGNVKVFKDQVEQHVAPIFHLDRQRAVLDSYTRAAIKRGARQHAIVFSEQAHRLDVTHQPSALQYARLMVRNGDGERGIRALKMAFGNSFTDPRAVRVAVDECLRTGEVRRAQRFLKRMKCQTPEDEGYAVSRNYRIGLELRGEDMGLAHEDRPSLWWMETPYPGNFGDTLNPYLVERLSGKPPIRAKRGEGMLAIGSVIKFARSGTKVWGTGTPRMTDVLSPDADYRAVRGPLTRELVRRSGGSPPDIFGDPAMLLPLVFRPNVPRVHRLGLILHHAHEAEPMVVEGVRRISILRVGNDQIEALLTELCSCQAIISTSLHGLIVAHAYGIPTKRAVFSGAANDIAGDGTKFEDHYAAMRIPYAAPLDLAAVDKIVPELAELCDEVMPEPFHAVDLLRAAPFDILPQYLEAARAGTGRLGSHEAAAVHGALD